MATIAVKEMEVIGSILSVTIPQLPCIEGTTQSWSTGDVIVDSSGSAVIAADGAAWVTILGQATAAAVGTTGSTSYYTPFIPGVTLIEANLCADASAGALVLAQTHFNIAYGLALDSGYFYINQGNTTENEVFAVPLYPAQGSAIGDTNARVVAVIVGSRFALAED